jgi:hypothetical protein
MRDFRALQLQARLQGVDLGVDIIGTDRLMMRRHVCGSRTDAGWPCEFVSGPPPCPPDTTFLRVSSAEELFGKEVK